jgi:protein-L-isoaspartate(D-aspartate) O-methyltransferase
MVNEQLRRRGIRDGRVLEAMSKVPRHEFVAEGSRQAAYEDRPLAIGDEQTISQPYIVAAMTEAIGVKPRDKVLEVGTGSGYQTAILAELGAEVTSVERSVELADKARERLERLGYGQVRIITGDGSIGYPAMAPYDAILVTAAAPRIPQALLDQLARDGRLIIPVGGLNQQLLELVVKKGDEFSVHALDPCQFVPLVGVQAWPENPR